MKDMRVTWGEIPKSHKKPWGNPKKIVSNPFGMQSLCTEHAMFTKIKYLQKLFHFSS